MLSAPAVGQRVALRYRPALRGLVGGLHGARGTIVLAGRGRPRNHLVRLDDGRRVIVPAGHLVAIGPAAR